METFLWEVQMPSTANIRRKMFILPIIDCYIEDREERSRLSNA
jgi:hypothetical protein